MKPEEKAAAHKHVWQYADKFSRHGFVFVCECGAYKELEICARNEEKKAVKKR